LIGKSTGIMSAISSGSTRTILISPLLVPAMVPV
jgi:hypothetical protein